MGESTRVLLGIVVLAGLGVSGAWIFGLGEGEIGDGEVPPVPPPPTTLVAYTTTTYEVVTDPQTIDSDGVIRFLDILVEVQNVTRVAINVHLTADGVSTNDEYELQVTAPDDESRIGTAQGPAQSLNGYDLVVPMIDDWPRALEPRTTRYDTGDQEAALRYASENNTDVTSTGPWEARLSMTPPPAATRQVVAEVTMMVSYYEGVAFPDDVDLVVDDPPASDTENETADPTPATEDEATGRPQNIHHRSVRGSRP